MNSSRGGRSVRKTGTARIVWLLHPEPLGESSCQQRETPAGIARDLTGLVRSSDLDMNPRMGTDLYLRGVPRQAEQIPAYGSELTNSPVEAVN